MSNLVIVESPAKAKTISNYLGSSYIVVASYGHVRELPSKNGSVDPDNKFQMIYEVIPKSEKIVANIVKLAKKADKIYLASDPDREGEAIAQAVLDLIIERNANVEQNIYRATFNEITKASVLEAIKNPRKIDKSLVDAQQARLSLDYLVGFHLSPVLWRKLPGSRSAGRVQSVALRIICDREEEIRRFQPQEYWSINASLSTKNKEIIQARVINFDDQNFNQSFPGNEDLATEIRNWLEAKKQVIVVSKESKEVKQNPYPPFTTSLLQQDASRKLGFSSKKTMQLAQQLYEGLEVDGQTKGLITYMRTDGMTIGEVALKQIRQYIGDSYSDKYLPKSPILYKTKAKNAQEAHEAIRPTDITITPEKLKKILPSDLHSLYDLIWRRTVACQMIAAIHVREVIDFQVADSSHVAKLRANGTRVKFDGFLRLYNNEDVTSDIETLPDVCSDDVCDINELQMRQHFTTPPARFSEANLIKTLEEYGIGRPSTYASIISILQDRAYATLEKKSFMPTMLGIVVNIFLKAFFLQYVEYDFTAKLENELDFISDAKLDRIKFLSAFWVAFSKNVNDTMSISFTEVLEKISPLIAFFANIQEGTPCPKCNSGIIAIKLGKFGPFVGCSKYPECDFIQNITENTLHSNEHLSSNTSNVTLEKYPSFVFDDKEVILKNGKYGKYLEVIQNGVKKNCSIPKNLPELTEELALFYSCLPKVIGECNGEKITLGIGKFGPYALCNKKFYNVKNIPLHEVSLAQVIDIINGYKK